MEPVNSTSIRVESKEALTGNVLPLLNELRHALQRLRDTGEEHSIDLRSIPLAPGEERHIEELLGTGEVEVRITALGLSTVQETAISGIWLVRHHNTENEPIGKLIEVTYCPLIVRSPAQDIGDGIQRLESLITDRQQTTCG